MRHQMMRALAVLGLLTLLLAMVVPAGQTTFAQESVAAAPELAAPDAAPAPCAAPCTTTLELGADPTSTDADTYIEEKNPSNNFGSATELRLKSQAGDRKRALVRWDMSSLPTGIEITDATLSFYVTGAQAHDVDVHQVLQSWTEGGATWNNDGFGNNWAGGNYNGTRVGFYTATPAGQYHSVSSGPLASMVGGWYTSPSTNHGVLLHSDEATTNESKIASKENGNNWPALLSIEYTCPSLASVGDFVWNDRNKDGVQNAGEPGIPGVPVHLLASDGASVVISGETDIYGAYRFECVPPGSYYVQVQAPDGVPLTAKGAGGNGAIDSDVNPGTGRTDLLSLAAGENLNVDAGLQGPNIPGGVNGLFFGDGDAMRYTLLAADSLGLGNLYGLLDGNKLQLAFVGGPDMNDNVFDAGLWSDYMKSVGWDRSRALPSLYNSERLIDITLTCGNTVIAQWDQGYLCDEDSLNTLYGTSLSSPYLGPLSGLQSLVEFQPSDALASSATNNGDYTFLDCHRDSLVSGTMPPNYTAATSLAWNFNNTTWETDRLYVSTGGTSTSNASTWRSPYVDSDNTNPGVTEANDTPNDLQYPYFDMVNLWEWMLVYEMEFDLPQACVGQPIYIGPTDIHNSPAKVADATFPKGQVVFYDWGDLPDGYNTVLASGGPNHVLVPGGGPYLGAAVDTDGNGQPTISADGDDLDANGDDEDGVTFLTPLVAGQMAKIQVVAGTAGYLSAFIDFETDGTLDAVTIASGSPTGTPGNPISDLHLAAPGTYQIWINVPSDAEGVMYSRFRFTQSAGQGGNATTGQAPNGEVEDYGLAELGDYVWEDLNGNGVQDEPASAGRNGVTVNLLDAAGNPVLDAGGNPLTTVTADDGSGNPGYYSFDGLPPGGYRVEFVPPTGYNFTLQGQGGDGSKDSDPDPASGITPVIGLGQGDSNNTIDAGLGKPGAIGNYVWVDENSDGYQDAGEPGLPNVVVVLYDAEGNEVARAVTDAHGGYLFSDLPPGTYYVDVQDGTGGQPNTLPAGMDQTPYLLPGADFGNQDHSTTSIPNTGFSGYQVSIGSGEENLTADFGYNWGNPPNGQQGDLGAIGDRVWIDANGDGVQDAGEPGLGGVQVTIYYDSNGDGVVEPGVDTPYTGAVDQNGNTGTGTTTTEPDSSYIFSELPAGQYVVVVDTPPAGYTQTGDPDHFGAPASTNPTEAGDNKTTTPIVLAPGDVFLNADFGYQPPQGGSGQIGDTVFFDLNGDGTYQPGNGEYGIPGVTVALALDANGNGQIDEGEIIATTTTGDDGIYLFTGLLLDDGDGDADYLVVVTDTDNVLGELDKTDGQNDGANNNSQDNPYPVTLNPGKMQDLTADFGYAPPGHEPGEGLIGDTVWFDLDNSGGDQTTKGDEPGIEGVLVELLDDQGTTIATTWTDENGNYYFGNLPLDTTYQVRVAASNFAPGGVLEGFFNTYYPGGGSANQGPQVTLTVAQPFNLNQDFSYYGSDGQQEVGNIGNLVWEDMDADGKYRPRGYDDVAATADDENPIGGVTVDLYRDLNGNQQVDPGEPRIATKTTAASTDAILYGPKGNYLFGGLPGGDYVVDVRDQYGVLQGYWHSLGPSQALDNQSKVDPFAINIATGSTKYIADFGYYLRPAALGNFVWYDVNGNNTQDQYDSDGAGGPDTWEPGLDGIEVRLIITYPNGDQILITTLTGDDPATTEIEHGWYSFGNLLLDEDYAQGSPTLDTPGANQPAYTIQIDPIPAGYAPSTPNATGDNMNDSDPHGGTAAVPIQGLTDVVQQADPTTETDPIAGYDFGLQVADMDFGDLPDVYGTYAASDGARHLRGGPRLGQGWDADYNGQASADASGDDSLDTFSLPGEKGDDEDGVIPTPGVGWTVPTGGSLDVTVTGAAGYVTAWIDWNNDGDLDDAQEQIMTNQFVPAGTTQSVLFGVPSGADLGNLLFARVRVYGSYQAPGTLSPTGQASDGEVEDYRFEPPPTAAVLVAFGARWQGNAVLLGWETASEIGLMGFDLYRTEQVDGPRTRVNAEMIGSLAPEGLGTSYQFLDETVAQGVSYYYWLYALDTSGAERQMGPVQVEAASPPEPRLEYRLFLPFVTRNY